MRRHSRSNSVGRLNELEKNHEKSFESPEKGKHGKRSAFKQYLMDYMENSNLHGLKYIGEKERTLPEKLFWVITFTFCVFISGYQIKKVWTKWNDTPVIVSFAENTTPVWEIPYPAVTFCFETKALQTVYNFTDNYHNYNRSETRENMTPDDRYMYEDLTLVCDSHLAFDSGRKFSNASRTIQNLKSMTMPVFSAVAIPIMPALSSLSTMTVRTSVMVRIKNPDIVIRSSSIHSVVAPNLTNVFFGCQWESIPKEDCSHLFSPILTEEGLCYTFNILPPEDLFRLENLHKDYAYLDLSSRARNNVTKTTWNLEEGYKKDEALETYPHRGTGYGAKSGLAFLMHTKESDLDYLCRGPVQGFKILLHNPAELPRLSQQYFRSPLSQEVVVAVKPNIMTTSEGLKPYKPERRKCYFPTERYLRYFKIYTQSNCEMECLANFTNERCDCVHFGLPHGPDMKVCNTGKVSCMTAAQSELVLFDIETGLNLEISKNESLQRAREVARKCHCLPACTSIEYDAELSQADYDWKAIFYAFKEPIPKSEEDMMYARVSVYFRDPQFITSRRSELYGQTDFLANCGGLLGLFMGFSILSVVEIMYFLTLRLVCVMWRRNKKNRIQERLNNDYNKPEKLQQD